LVTNDLSDGSACRRSCTLAGWDVSPDVFTIRLDPIGRNRALGRLKVDGAAANKRVQFIFQLVFHRSIVGLGLVGLRPEVPNRITGAELQADQVIDLILVWLVRCDSVAGICLSLHRLRHVTNFLGVARYADIAFRYG